MLFFFLILWNHISEVNKNKGDVDNGYENEMWMFSIHPFWQNMSMYHRVTTTICLYVVELEKESIGVAKMQRKNKNDTKWKTIKNIKRKKQIEINK